MQLVEKNSPAQVTARKTALFDERHITEFATGSLAACFGPEYATYDTRRAPRTPNGDLQLISRVLSVDGTRGRVVAGSSLITEYDVPEHPWYCEQNAYPNGALFHPDGNWPAALWIFIRAPRLDAALPGRKFLLPQPGWEWQVSARSRPARADHHQPRAAAFLDCHPRHYHPEICLRAFVCRTAFLCRAKPPLAISNRKH